MLLQLTLLTLPLLTFAQQPPATFSSIASSISAKYSTLAAYKEIVTEFPAAAPPQYAINMNANAEEASAHLAIGQSLYLATQTVWKDIPTEVAENLKEAGRQAIQAWFASESKEATTTPKPTTSTSKEISWSLSLENSAVSAVYEGLIWGLAAARPPPTLRDPLPKVDEASSILVSQQNEYFATQTVWEGAPAEVTGSVKEAAMRAMQAWYAFASEEATATQGSVPSLGSGKVAWSPSLETSAVSAAYKGLINGLAQVHPGALWQDPSLDAGEASSILASQQNKYFATQRVWKDAPAEVTESAKEAGRQSMQAWFASVSKEATTTPKPTASTSKEISWPPSIERSAMSAMYEGLIIGFSRDGPPLWRDRSLKADKASSILASRQNQYFATQTVWKDAPTKVTESIKESALQVLQAWFAPISNEATPKPTTSTSEEITWPPSVESSAMSAAYKRLTDGLAVARPPPTLRDPLPKSDEASSILVSQQNKYFATQTVWRDAPTEVAESIKEAAMQSMQAWYASVSKEATMTPKPTTSTSKDINWSSSIESSAISAGYKKLAYGLSVAHLSPMLRDPLPEVDEASSILVSQQNQYFATQRVWKDAPAEVTGSIKEAAMQSMQAWFASVSKPTTSTSTWSSLEVSAAPVVHWVDGTSVLRAGNAAASTELIPAPTPTNAQEDADSAAAGLGVKMAGAALGGIVVVALVL